LKDINNSSVKNVYSLVDFVAFPPNIVFFHWSYNFPLKAKWRSIPYLKLRIPHPHTPSPKYGNQYHLGIKMTHKRKENGMKRRKERSKKTNLTDHQKHRWLQ
jgi:hypothetical protein